MPNKKLLLDTPEWSNCKYSTVKVHCLNKANKSGLSNWSELEHGPLDLESKELTNTSIHVLHPPRQVIIRAHALHTPCYNLHRSGLSDMCIEMTQSLSMIIKKQTEVIERRQSRDIKKCLTL